jgi:small redox-active disulfide protein 2
MAAVVEVLGPGCRRCSELLELVREVARTETPGVEARYVTDPAEIVGRGFFMRTPALVVDGVVVAVGRVPSRREISAWLQVPPVNQEGHP